MLFKIGFLFLCTIVAFWISAICGGGASLILIPILSQLLSSSAIPVSLTIGTFTSSASRIYFFRKHIKWYMFFWFVPFAIPSVWLGAYLIKYANPIYIEFFIALFLISNIREFLKPKKALLASQKPYSKYVLSIIGFFAGFVSGLTGAVGLLFNKFYLRYGLTKEEIVATRAANEIFLHLIKLILYFSLGLATTNAIWLGLTIAIASIVSTYTIKFILPYLSEIVFRKIGYGAMFFAGVFMLITTSSKIVTHDHIYLNTLVFNDGYETQFAWRESNTSLEFSYDDGFEIEIKILYEELPEQIRQKYEDKIRNATAFNFEKVFTKNGVIYELNMIKNDSIYSYEEKSPDDE